MQLYPPQRAQSIPEVLDTAFKLFSTSLLKVLPYGMLGTLAGQLGNIYNLATGRPLQRFLPRDPASWVVLAMSLALSMALWAAMLLRQRAISQAAPVSMPAELNSVARRLPALAVTRHDQARLRTAHRRIECFHATTSTPTSG